ncbi:hypothetical protein EHS39_14260 [Ensifer sp. MPMI2T]|nr:hypothetical protein EHS39_14260 [Ensifer sp. MPMI2T]
MNSIDAPSVPFGQLPPETFVASLKPAMVALDALKMLDQDDPAEPSELSLRAVEMIPRVFQVRGGDVNEGHVGELLAGLKRDGRLDPITVWRCGRHALLVDGHHRLEAYRLYQSEKRKLLNIPVRWFHGSAGEAMREAARANCMAKLPMTYAQRANYAWALTLYGDVSKKETASLSGTSTTLVAKMRLVQKALGLRAGSFDQWDKALRDYQRSGAEADEQADFASKDWVKEKGQRIADRLGRTFSTRLSSDPEATAYGLISHMPRSAGLVAREVLEGLGLTVKIFDRDGNEIDDLEDFNEWDGGDLGGTDSGIEVPF